MSDSSPCSIDADANKNSDSITEAEGRRAIKHMHEQAILHGLDKLSEEEIEAEIEAVRSKRGTLGTLDKHADSK